MSEKTKVDSLISAGSDIAGAAVGALGRSCKSSDATAARAVVNDLVAEGV